MIQRVTQSALVRVLSANTSRLQSELVHTQAVVSSQKRLQAASDDPVGTALVNGFRAETRRLESLLDGVGFGRAVLGAEDAALDEVHALLTRAKELAVTFSGGVHTAESRATAAEESEQIERALLSLGNTTVAGRHVFGGLARGTPPFVGFDDPAYDPDVNGSTYSGPTDPFSIQTAADQLVRLTTPGDQVFDDAILAVHQLTTALRNNDVDTPGTGIIAAIDNVEAASEGARQERASVGGRLGRLNTRDGEMRDAIVGARTRQGEIEDADLTQVLIELAQLQNALEVTLTAGQALLATNILDFVRL